MTSFYESTVLSCHTYISVRSLLTLKSVPRKDLPVDALKAALTADLAKHCPPSEGLQSLWKRYGQSTLEDLIQNGFLAPSELELRFHEGIKAQASERVADALRFCALQGPWILKHTSITTKGITKALEEVLLRPLSLGELVISCGLMICSKLCVILCQIIRDEINAFIVISQCA
jgi:hypothetical protein